MAHIVGRSPNAIHEPIDQVLVYPSTEICQDSSDNGKAIDQTIHDILVKPVQAIAQTQSTIHKKLLVNFIQIALVQGKCNPRIASMQWIFVLYIPIPTYCPSDRRSKGQHNR